MLIAKLQAYGFSKIALNLINDYLSNRFQRTKIGEKFSTWLELIYGVPQGSILGAVFFNVYINDLFLFSQHFHMANYADDCSPYEFSNSIDDVIIKLQNDSKCLLLSDTCGDLSIKIVTETISNSTEEKILGVYFDNKLNFNIHIRKLCKKASQKLHALARLSNLMSIRQRKTIMNAFINSQFSYCPLIWMCHSRTTHSIINNIHERTLRIVYKDNISSFAQLLEKANAVTIHHRNIQVLAIEIYKALNKLSSPLMSELFKLKEIKYSLRKGNVLVSANRKNTDYGINSVSHLASKIWDLVPEEIKNSKSLPMFKQKIKLWIPRDCHAIFAKHTYQTWDT